MKNLTFLYVGLAVMTMPACSEKITDGHLEGDEILLGAAVGDMQISSRAVADPYLGGTISSAKPLNAAVWFRKDERYYANEPDSETNLPAHARVTFDGPGLEYVYRDAERRNSLKYPTDGSVIQCIGLYPDDEGTVVEGVETGWKTTDNRTASHKIDGTKDLMFAKEISGSWNNPFDKSLEFKHLLTWVKINICATSHDAVDAWGKILRIYISSDPELKIDLESGNCTYIKSDNEADAFIPTMYKLNTDPDPVTLSTATQEVGSVLCSPETEYKLWIVSLNKSGEQERRTVDMKLTLMGDDDTIKDIETEEQAVGKCFVFSLYFTPYKVVEGVCTLNSWNNQNEDIYLQ